MSLASLFHNANIHNLAVCGKCLNHLKVFTKQIAEDTALVLDSEWQNKLLQEYGLFITRKETKRIGNEQFEKEVLLIHLIGFNT